MSGETEDSLGMLLIGFTIATWLFGANTLQTYVYFQTQDDKFLLKAVVIIVFLADMLNTIFTCWGIYLELVPLPVVSPHGSVPLVLQCTASDIAILVVQCFFAQSVYQVSGRKNAWLVAVILVLATMAFASGIALTAASITALYVGRKTIPMANEVLFALSLGLVTLTDIVITVSLVWYLFGVRASAKQQVLVLMSPPSDNWAQRTAHLLDQLILYCVHRGILTTVSHALVLALWFTLPKQWAWTLFQFSLGKVFTLTFLTILNRRENKRYPNGHRPSHLDSGIKFQPDSQQGDVVIEP